MPEPIITKFRTLYEFLVRFDENGALKGAHAQYLEGMKEDGVVIHARAGAAIPLSLVDAADKATLRAILGDTLTPIIEAKEAAEADALAARAEFKAKDDNIQKLMGEKVELEEQIAAAAQTEVGKLKAELEAKDANVQELMAKVIDLGGTP